MAPSSSAAGAQAPQTLYLDNFILAENLEVDISAPNFAKCSAHRVLGDMRHVAVARKMREREFPQARRREAPDEIARLVIREVAARACDALDQAWMAAAFAQENRVVVRL